MTTLSRSYSWSSHDKASLWARPSEIKFKVHGLKSVGLFLTLCFCIYIQCGAHHFWKLAYSLLPPPPKEKKKIPKHLYFGVSLLGTVINKMFSSNLSWWKVTLAILVEKTAATYLTTNLSLSEIIRDSILKPLQT